MVVLVPVPVFVISPGEPLIVHVPVDGRPSRTTLPVATSQVGAVMVPTTGAAGVGGWESILTSLDAAEVHPLLFVTVK